MSWFKRKTAKPQPPSSDKGFEELNDLCRAAKDGDVKALEKHFGGHSVEYMQVSLSGQLALGSACEGGSEAAVRYMLDIGVPPDCGLKGGYTPEGMAAEFGHHHILLVLREYMVKAGKEPTELMEKAQALADAQKMLEMTKVVTSAPVLQKDINVRNKPLKFRTPKSP